MSTGRKSLVEVAEECDADERLVEYLECVDIFSRPEITGCGTKGATLRFADTIPSVLINRMDTFGVVCDGLYYDEGMVLSVMVDDSGEVDD